MILKNIFLNYEKVKFKLKENTNIKVLNTEKRLKNNISIFSKSKINTLSSYNLNIQNKNIMNNNKGINSVSPIEFSINQNSSFTSSNTKYEKKINNILSNCKPNIKKIYSSKSSLIEKPKNEIKNKIEINKKRVLKEINNNNYKYIIENKKSDEDNNKYCNTITINSLGKGHFNLDFKSLADIGKRIKLNSLKKCPE